MSCPYINYSNITENSSSRDVSVCDISRITLHHMAGGMSGKQCADFFCNTGRQASANFCISDDYIAESVPLERRAWTSSSRKNDNKAITFELSNIEIGGDWKVSKKTLDNTVDVVLWFAKQYGKTKFVRAHSDSEADRLEDSSTLVFTEHNFFAATGCPGPYMIREGIDYVIEQCRKKIKENERNDDIVKCPYCGMEILLHVEKMGEAQKPQPQKKSNEEVAREVIRGEWGNGADRVNRLTAEGYDAGTIQDIVNRLLG